MSSSYGGYGHQSQYAPSAPQQPPYSSYYQTSTSNVPPPSNSSSSYNYANVSSSGSSSFPPGTPQDVITSFQMVDRDRSGFIDERELQQALSSGFHRFNLSTIRLLMFLFKNPHQPLAVGPKEFAALWSCLGQWRGIFERYDKDRSGKIDPLELRDALYGIGYAVPGSVLQLLLSKYGDGSGRRVELCFDSFVECGMIIKGLTDKFKEKDTRYTGSATLSYDAFMTMVLPFLVSYD
ncbi:probable calcium-binding protein CML48 [Vigna unguiculata]|uniref:Calcium-binding protein CML n=1 Tax=Vigna unguiculata TaxID=3917 RepID=A0A4D6N849_VIGUN|nr:probable calcium-binding protein CML48 [Vigna unguiculata]QCE09468.1 calcium-binding protein CML [Vigna unguiculata]